MREVKRHITVLGSYTLKGEYLLVIIKNSNKKGLFFSRYYIHNATYYIVSRDFISIWCRFKDESQQFKCKNLVVSWVVHSSGKIQGVDRLSGVKATGD